MIVTVPMVKRVLFVDDEPMLLSAMRASLRRERHRFDITCVHDGIEALAAWDRAAFDVVVTDMRMPGLDGAQLLRALTERGARPFRVLLSGYADESRLRAALPYCDCVLTKPCPRDELLAAIDRA